MSKHSWRDPHILRTEKSLLRVLYGTLGFFLFLFVLFHIGGALYASTIGAKSSGAFRAGIERDLAYLKEQGDQVANNNLLQEYLLAKDSEKLVALSKKEVAERNIGLMGVADDNGTLLSRTKSVGNLGNNIFLTNPVARLVAQGKSAQSVEATVGFDPRQIFLNTGRPIMRGGRMIGALTANYLTDDAYARRFRDTYLPGGVEVAFYNKNAGIYGDSFADEATRTRINSYFNSGSEWFQNGSSGKTISFSKDSFYLVENSVFPGLEQSPGGALLFIPRHDISSTTNILLAFLTVCVFVFYMSWQHLRSRGEERGWRYYVLFVAASVPVFILVLVALRLQTTGYLKLERVPYTLYNSTLRFQPEWGIYDIGFEQRFTIVVDTGDEPINAVEVGLVFDPGAVEIKALDVASSTCSYVIENSIDTKEGRAHLSCVIVNSGEENRSLSIVDVVAMPRRTGTFTLSFDSAETKVLANDGLGTNVLRMSQAGSYQVHNFDSTFFQNVSTTSAASSFVVFSPTHPNQGRWYNAPTARFVWLGKPGVVYAYELNNLPDTIPSNAHTTQIPKVDIPIPGDGIFYFHLRFVSGGPVAHYRIQADMSPPSITSIHLSADKIFVGDVVRFSFDAEDKASGIQNNYYVDLGNHLFLPVGSQLFVPFLKAGDQKVVLRVYDTAGNYIEKSQTIDVETPY